MSSLSETTFVKRNGKSISVFEEKQISNEDVKKVFDTLNGVYFLQPY